MKSSKAEVNIGQKSRRREPAVHQETEKVAVHR